MSTSSYGITPAHAGKTGKCLESVPKAWDHPRACGENQTTDRGKGQFAGSPPRMRGKHDNGDKRITQPRITPAHAGKTGGNGSKRL